MTTWMTGPAVRPTSVGLLGHPVAHSLSPVFQQAALDAAGIPLRYGATDVPPDALPQYLTAQVRTGWAGNITVPHKEAVADRCAIRTPAAQHVGAVNTVWTDASGRLVGHNTDLDGVRATLDALLGDGPVAQAVVLGAGGAAAAVCVAIAERLTGSLAVVARTESRGVHLLQRLGVPGRVTTPGSDQAKAALSRASLVVNATPIGQRDTGDPVPLAWLSPAARVFDLVYRPEGTPWVRAARAEGWIAEDGLRMLVEQGAAAFRCWFGIEAPRDAMWRALGVAMPLRWAPRELPE